MFSRGIVGLDATARVLGYEPSVPEPVRAPSDQRDERLAASPPSFETEEIRVKEAALPSVPFWRLEARDAPPGETQTTDPGSSHAKQIFPDGPLCQDGIEPAVFAPLTTWRKLVPRLRQVAGRQTSTAELDVDAIIRQLSQGISLAEVPRRRCLRWGPRIQLIVDRSERLIPYWQDQDLVWERLRRLYPRHAFEAAWISDGMEEPVFALGRRGGRRYEAPPPGTLVLILSDLGCLDHGGDEVQRCWNRLTRRLTERDLRYVALVPCPRERIADVPHEARGTIVCWESPSPTSSGRRLHRQELAGRAHRLLTLVSPAIRIEPGLLRAVRLLQGMGDADAGTESDVWQHPWIIGRCCVAATLHPQQARKMRQEFEALPKEIQRQTLEAIRRWRQGLRPEIWYEELLGLGRATQQYVPADEIQAAREFFIDVASQWRTTQLQASETARKAWFHRVQRRLPDHIWHQHDVRQALYRLWWFTSGDDPNVAPPPGWELREIPEDAQQYELQGWLIRQVGNRLRFTLVLPMASAASLSVNAPPDTGSLLASLLVRRPLIHVATQEERAFWKSGQPPAWAVDWGEDEFGSWVEFDIVGVRQRMRWIAPGTFQMGSPDDEPGRYGADEAGGIWNEGPQHQVTISRGFWLFDTPCTQALWQAVMGANPSRFKSPDRPVEQVSWEDCQLFLAKINELVPELDLSLPTEAQWEYGCRAGTDTATYDGSLEILGENNAPALDPIAWYGGNSGVEFDRDNGYESTGWPDKQYDHRRAGSHPVRGKKSNPWGLYDMLGNVWEWCHDSLRAYTPKAVTDPVGSTGRGADRVLRGGSWSSSRARSVRCAHRQAYHPGFRYGSIGFRPARVQQPQEQASAGALVAEPASPALGRKGVARPTQDQPGGADHVAASLRDAPPGLGETERHSAQLIRLSSTAVGECPLPQATNLIIATDCEKLTFRRITRPEWASAIGRDRFGLWVEFEVPGRESKPVTQRMRWIPPGRFTMGSPPEEPGRPTKQEIDQSSPYWPDEGPQHLVTISQGFWLFDTPCTQALWEAVMGENPSRFKGPDRPVEQVSWDDCQGFLIRINSRFKGLDLSLPTEAQWEYACREGTDTATYAGPLEVVAEDNAPGLDEIGWYRGNSGVDFDLSNGYDLVVSPNEQHDERKAGTHPVAQKLPNSWGLYDMLGNVWEWCLISPHSHAMANGDMPLDRDPETSSAETSVHRLRNLLKTLSYRQREIVKLRYGLDDGYAYTLEEVGHIFRITRERVRQIEQTAMGRVPELRPLVERLSQRATDRVLRGGSWLDNANHVRYAIRRGAHLCYRNWDAGLRPARVQQSEDHVSSSAPVAERPNEKTTS